MDNFDFNVIALHLAKGTHLESMCRSLRKASICTFKLKFTRSIERSIQRSAPALIKGRTGLILGRIAALDAPRGVLYYSSIALERGRGLFSLFENFIVNMQKLVRT